MYSLKVCHEKKLNFHRVILPELYEIIGDEYFVPIAFRSALNNDYFFIRDQGKALIKLFQSGLRIVIRDRSSVDSVMKYGPVDLIVKFCVARFRKTMLCPRSKLAMIVSTSVDASRRSRLSLLSSHRKLVDAAFSLRNKGCFAALCDQITAAQMTMLNVKTLDLSNNEISDLQPLSRLTGLTFFALDLKFNQISSIKQFEFVKNLRVQEIFLEGNPVTALPLFVQKLKEILPSLKKIDRLVLNETNHLPIQILKFDNRSDKIRNFNTVNVLNAGQITSFVKEEFPKQMNNSWNKVVVEHKGKVRKDTILYELNKQFFNRTQFHPCYYKQGRNRDYFYLYQNFSALNTMVMKNLTIKIPPTNFEIKLQLYMKCAEWCDGQIDWRDKINYVIRKRIIGSVLSLDDFEDDSDLSDLFVSLSIVQGLSSIITQAQRINDEIATISFRRNRISNIEGFTYLKHFTKLISIDLSSNLIESFEGLPELPNIVEMFLDRNPICLKYYDEPRQYIKDLRKAFPRLEYIDGRRIDKNSETVSFQNFLIKPNVYTLAERFIKFFFGFYDSTHRSSLINLYEHESLFSLSSEIVDMTASTKKYQEYSRNLLHRKELEESELCVGRLNIIEFFDYLPQTQHDFVTMNIDVPFLTDETIIIHVNGYFKEIGQTLNAIDKIYGFTRSFVLKQRDEKFGDMFKYVILNEQLHIRDISQEEINWAFKKDAVTDENMNSICKDMLPSDTQQEYAIILLLNKITNLKKLWCRR